MARIRTIKPDFFEDEEVEEKLNDTQQRLFIGLWCLADREGVLEDRPKLIRGKLFMHRAAYKIEPDLKRLADHGFVCRYTVDERLYIWIVNFLKHQRPNTREGKSTFPGHDMASSCTCMRVLARGEREGKGKGMDKGKGIEKGKGDRGEGDLEAPLPRPIQNEVKLDEKARRMFLRNQLKQITGKGM